MSPVDPVQYPDQDRAIIEAEVEAHVSESEIEIDATAQELEGLCHVQVPLKYSE